MNRSLLRKLYESNSGDISIVTRGKKINVLLNIIRIVSPIMGKMLSDEKDDQTREVDMSHFHPDNIDRVLRYIYYRETKFYDSASLNCELLILVEQCELPKFKDMIIKNINNITSREMDEGTRAKLISQYLSCIDDETYPDIRDKFIEYISNKLIGNIANKVCYDTKGGSEYKWCCKHNNAESTSNNCSSVREGGKYACICICMGMIDMIEPYDIENFFVDRCCLHRNICINEEIYDYKYLKSLPEDVISDTMKILLNPVAVPSYTTVDY
jgi:hypothetical protein